MKKEHFHYLGLLAIFIAGFICVWLYSLFTPVALQEAGYDFYLRPGMSKRTVISALSQQGIIKHPFLLSLYAYPQKNAVLKVGEYHFAKGSTPHSIWKQITTGTGLLYHPFSIIPGWTFKQLRNELLNQQQLRHITATLDDKQIMTQLGYPNASPEGEFYPDTYYYTKGDTDLTILKRAFNLMQTKMQTAWQTRSADLPYKNIYEALIAASMIEKEGYLDSERPIISGVIINRLKKDMLLQIDATVIFGLGDRYNGKIHKENLLENTVYNTYVHKGLPPTPIALPGFSSINAAVHPQRNSYFYYVAKGDGSHQFSSTLQAHNEAIQSNLNKNGNFNEAPIRKQMENLLSPPAPQTSGTPLTQH